jgi:hypothetical protein
VEKVSLKLANMQGLVGPKPQGKPLEKAKGNPVKIPELYILVFKAVKPPCDRIHANVGTEEFSFLYNHLPTSLCSVGFDCSISLSREAANLSGNNYSIWNRVAFHCHL